MGSWAPSRLFPAQGCAAGVCPGRLPTSEQLPAAAGNGACALVALGTVSTCSPHPDAQGLKWQLTVAVWPSVDAS